MCVKSGVLFGESRLIEAAVAAVARAVRDFEAAPAPIRKPSDPPPSFQTD